MGQTHRPIWQVFSDSAGKLTLLKVTSLKRNLQV